MENDNQYSGSGDNDPRDPKLVHDSVPELMAELQRRADESDLLSARVKYIDLSNRRASGEPVSEAELSDARTALLAQEERVRRPKLPDQ